MCFKTGTTTLKDEVASCQESDGDYSCICKAGYKHTSDSDKMCVLV